MNTKYEKFIELYRDVITVGANASKYHTFRTQGIVDIVAMPKNQSELIDMISTCKKYNYIFRVIGNGSNILFKDGKYNGILIVTKNMNSIKIECNEIICDAGALMPSIANKSLTNELSGLEELAGIPGTIGGAIRMNAGAYGKEIKDILTNITVLDSDNNVLNLKPVDLSLSYRHSNVSEKNYIVLGCTLSLAKDSYSNIKSIMDSYKQKRTTSQPLEYPNAGSIFKKEGDFFAGKLIDECGLKGFSIGGAMVSPKHANFIVNTASATYSDIINLIAHIQDTISKEFNVYLKTEVEVI